MTNIENILNNKYVDKGSYKVPDNYFCQLQNSITERIKQENGTSDSTAIPANVPKKKFFLLTPRFRYAVAACFIGAAVLTAVGLSHYNKEKNIVAEQQDLQSEQYYNECMEYAMVDNDDIYTYLAEQ